MPLRPLRRLEIELERAKTSEIVGMVSIFLEAFQFENPKLAQIIHDRSKLGMVVEDILRTHLHSEHKKFIIAYDTTKGLVPDPGFEDYQNLDENMSYGWISVGIVPHGATLSSYAASDLFVYAFLKLLAEEGRDRGEDSRQLDTNDPRVRLAYELGIRSKEGQTRHVNRTHMVVNTLTMWPDSHSDSTWEMALKLLQKAVEYAERHDWPIWTQIPAGQMPFFSQAGFKEVKAFTLDLSDYGTAAGTQEWVHMLYSAPERRARSISPGDRGGKRPRPGF